MKRRAWFYTPFYFLFIQKRKSLIHINTKKERENLFLFTPPNDHKGRGWSSLETVSHNSIHVSHTGAKHRSSWTFICCLSRHIGKKLYLKQGNWDLNHHAYTGYHCHNQWLNLLCHNAGSNIFPKILSALSIIYAAEYISRSYFSWIIKTLY